MAESLSELVVEMSLDTDDFLNGIDTALRNVQKVGEQIRGSMSEASAAVEAGAAGASEAVKEVSSAVADAGKKSSDAADETEKSFGRLPSVFENVRTHIVSMFGALSGAVAAAKLFDNYVSKADGLNSLSRKIGMSVETIDAWSKANEAAGGTAEALQASLASFYQKTGRPATEFLKLGEKIEGMSRLQAQRFLEAQGVALDAIPVFLNGQKAADELVAKYRKTAFTTQDAKNASAFKTAWLDFKIAAQDVGNVFLRALVPVLTKVLDALSGGVSIVRDNIRFFTMLGAAIAGAFAARSIRSIQAATAAVRAFMTTTALAAKPLIALAAVVATVALALDDLITFAKGGDSALERVLKNGKVSAETIDELRSAFQAVGKAFSDAWDAVAPFVGDALKAALKVVSFIVGGIAVAFGLVAAAITKVVLLISDLIDWFGDLGDKAGSWLGEIDEKAERLGKTVGEWIASIPNAIADAFAGATDAVGDFFGSWFEIFQEKVIAPITGALKGALGGINDAWSGVKSFFGFGDGDGSDGATPAAREVVVSQGKFAPPQITSSSNLYMTNNISTRDDPTAIGSSVGRFAYAGAQRSNGAFFQAMRGVRLK